MLKTYLRYAPIHVLLGVALLFVCAVSIGIVQADMKSDLEQKIADRNRDIANLEAEIKSFQDQITSLGKEANSLKATIKTLDLSNKKLAADISLTENKIDAKNLEIQRLAGQISKKENDIDDDHSVIKSSLSLINQNNDQNLFELFLSGKSISSVLNNVDQVALLQSKVIDRVNNLREVKADLESNQRATEKAKADLIVLNKQLKDQRQVIINTQSEKNSLLAQTKQSEAQYQKMLALKKKQKAAFDQEVLTYESQLKAIITKIPHTGSGVLAWPLDQVEITQYFGDTPFATANPQIYNGRGHTGVDFRASIGTPVKAALSGVVSGVANTDIVRGCYSYGKWITLKHADGLTTLYAHLSVQSVTVGQEVVTGQILGYSGNTGYTTGPHLHFGVYATEGIEIKKFSSSVNCKGAVIPVASFNAYLNPLSYL